MALLVIGKHLESSAQLSWRLLDLAAGEIGLQIRDDIELSSSGSREIFMDAVKLDTNNHYLSAKPMKSRRRASNRLELNAAFVHFRNILQTIITLASASLGLIAALAWNDAIRATMKKILGPDDSIPALYLYAMFATFLGIVVVSVLGYFASKLGGEAIIKREAEG